MVDIVQNLPPEKSIEAAIANFLQDVAAGHSPATARTYRNALSRFCAYLRAYLELDPATLPVSKLNPDWGVQCVRWIAIGQPAKNAPPDTEKSKTPKTTVATYVAGLSRFYRWCALERLVLLPSDEYERMTIRFKDLRGKVQRTIIDKVPADEVLEALVKQARLAYANTDMTPGGQGRSAKLLKLDELRHQMIKLRNISLLEVLKSTGARVSEVSSLTRADLDGINRRARVVGKGSKERWIYFSPAAWETMQDYMLLRGKIMLGADEQPAEPRRRRSHRVSELGAQPVFARHDRGAGWKQVKPLSSHAIENLLWELVEETGLDVVITPHKFRHWFATKMLAATADLATTQDLLGHSNPATTRIYAQVSEKKKQSAHQQVFGE